MSLRKALEINPKSDVAIFNHVYGYGERKPKYYSFIDHMSWPEIRWEYVRRNRDYQRAFFYQDISKEIRRCLENGDIANYVDFANAIDPIGNNRAGAYINILENFQVAEKRMKYPILVADAPGPDQSSVKCNRFFDLVVKGAERPPEKTKNGAQKKHIGLAERLHRFALQISMRNKDGELEYVLTRPNKLGHPVRVLVLAKEWTYDNVPLGSFTMGGRALNATPEEKRLMAGRRRVVQRIDPYPVFYPDTSISSARKNATKFWDFLNGDLIPNPKMPARENIKAQLFIIDSIANSTRRKKIISWLGKVETSWWGFDENLPLEERYKNLEKHAFRILSREWKSMILS